jgi:hypothetical protein
MKHIDTITLIYKSIQEKHLPVYVETSDNKTWHVTTKDHLLSLHQFHSRQSAVEFCKYLDLKILAFVKHKNLKYEAIFD